MKLKFQLHKVKKSIIFSLKLSEIEIIKKNRKENPVVIIDDITSYFDEDRRKSILDFSIKEIYKY